MRDVVGPEVMLELSGSLLNVKNNPQIPQMTQIKHKTARPVCEICGICG